MTKYHPRRYRTVKEKRALWDTLKAFACSGYWNREIIRFELLEPGTSEYENADFEEVLVAVPYIGEFGWVNTEDLK
jgi:hypothetical protein